MELIPALPTDALIRDQPALPQYMMQPAGGHFHHGYSAANQQQHHVPAPLVDEQEEARRAECDRRRHKRHQQRVNKRLWKWEDEQRKKARERRDKIVAALDARAASDFAPYDDETASVVAVTGRWRPGGR
jgi:hypothetical protein